MTSKYNLIVSDNYGNPIVRIDPKQFIRLEYIRKEGEIGSLYLDLPPYFPLDLFQVDGQIEVMRSVEGGNFERDMEAVWLIRLVRSKTNNNERTIHILCHDAVDILDRRIVAYASGTTQAKKTDYADDMIKAIVRENYGLLATDTNRDISQYMAIDDDVSLAPSITKEFAWRKTLELIQEIANDSSGAGSYLTFDVVHETKGMVRFRTYSGCRGVDRGSNSSRPFVASIENGLLSYATIATDHIEERNYIYAGGQGKEVNRVVATAEDDIAINSSPINRREDFIDASNTDDVNAAQSEANHRLQEAKTKVAINGHLQQFQGGLYGVDYGFGDIIVADINKQRFDVHLDTVHITVNNDGSEEVEVYSRNLDETEY